MLLSNPFKPDPRVLKEAESLVKGGYDVTILAWDREMKYPKIEIYNRIKIVRIQVFGTYGKINGFFRGLSSYYLKSLLWLRKKKFDIVHANDFDTLPLAVILKKLYGWKVIYDAHDLYSGMIGEVVSPPIPNILFLFERYLIKYADGRITATDPLGKYLFSGYEYSVVMNSPKIDEYRISNIKIKEFRDKINPKGLFTIVYIGILDINRPLPLIIKAIENIPNVLLIIGGKGPNESEILSMINGKRNIKYVGWVNKEDIPLYTSASDLIILTPNPNKIYTKVAVANKLMEALAAGKPVISSIGTAAGSIVKECKAGLLCPYGDIECLRDKIEYLMQHPEEREKFGKNARRCAEKKYNWGLMEKRLLKLYASVI